MVSDQRRVVICICSFLDCLVSSFRGDRNLVRLSVASGAWLTGVSAHVACARTSHKSLYTFRLKKQQIQFSNHFRDYLPSTSTRADLPSAQ